MCLHNLQHNRQQCLLTVLLQCAFMEKKEKENQIKSVILINHEEQYGLQVQTLKRINFLIVK